MRQHTPPQPGGTVLYAEDHCGLRWPLLSQAILWPALLVVSIVIIVVTGNPDLSFLPVIALLGTWFGIIAVAINRPAGIRVTTDGVCVGGVRHEHQRHARGRKDPRALPPASAQRRQLFCCPWPAIQHLEVITDPAEVRKLAKSRHGDGLLAVGRLWAPFMTAALVIQVDLKHASVPEFRPPDTRRYWFKVSRPGSFVISPVWFAPTRHPAALRAVLAQRNDPATRRPG
jgi:hypothetical protein